MLNANPKLHADRTGFEICMYRFVGTSFGALATFPLYCIGEISVDGFADAIEEKSEVWRSLLIVAGEFLRCIPDATEKARPALDSLLEVTRILQSSYIELLGFGNLSAHEAIAAYDRLAAAYLRIPVCVEFLSEHLGDDVDLTLVADMYKLRETYYMKSLRWFGEEVRERKLAAIVSSVV